MLNNIFWLFVDKIFRVLIQVVVGGIVAKYLGTEGFGRINYTMGILFILSPIAILGFDSVLVKYFVDDSINKNNALKTGFLLRVAGSVVQLVLCVMLSLVLRISMDNLYLVFIFWVSYLFNAFDVIDYYFQSQVKSRYTVISKTVVLGIFSLLKILLIYFNRANVTNMSVIMSAELALASLILLIPKNKFSDITFGNFDIEMAKELLKEAWPLVLSGLAVISFMRLDQLIIEYYFGTAEVGIYAAAARLIEPMGFFTTIIISTFYPKLIKLYKEDVSKFKGVCQWIFSLFFYASVLIGVGAYYASPHIIQMLYGGAYAKSSAVFSVLAVGLIFTFSGSLRAQILVIEKNTRFHIYNVLIGLFVLSVTSIIFVPLWGSIGAAVSIVISYFFTGVISSFVFPKLRYIGILQIKAVNFFYLNPSVLKK